MTPLEKLDRRIARARETLQNLLDERDDLLAETTIIECSGCKTQTPIKDLTYIQTHWYTPPHGCSGGDYWNEGEGQVDCPGCNSRLRLYTRPDIQKLRHLFKDRTNEYENR